MHHSETIEEQPPAAADSAPAVSHDGASRPGDPAEADASSRRLYRTGLLGFFAQFDRRGCAVPQPALESLPPRAEERGG
ncbi:MAG TPA: hypothetical protein VG710_00885 [Opitutus sp.]|nr:hypothetical protein [Opitutus sp.]